MHAPAPGHGKPGGRLHTSSSASNCEVVTLETQAIGQPSHEPVSEQSITCVVGVAVVNTITTGLNDAKL